MNSGLSEKAAANFLYQVFKLWIDPELLRRSKGGTLYQNCTIQRCLIRLPNDRPAIVDFNEEVRWLATIKVPPRTSIEKGSPVSIHQVETVDGVAPCCTVFIVIAGSNSERMRDSATVARCPRDAWLKCLKKLACIVGSLRYSRNIG